MGFFRSLINRFGIYSGEQVKAEGQQAFKRAVNQLRRFEGAKANRLNADWMSTDQPIDRDLFADLRKLRERARDLAQNTPYGARANQLIRANVVGSKGIRLQVKSKNPDNSPDLLANRKIEEQWEKWIKRKYCSVSGTQSLRQFLSLAAITLFNDGECIIRLVKGFNNPFKFALQHVDASMLDHTLWRERNTETNEIRMGVELDEWGKPVKYHFRGNPQETAYYRLTPFILPADEVIHLLIPSRIGQTRGYPATSPVMMTIKMLAGYEEAEVTAARVEASKMGFIFTPTGNEYGGEKVAASGARLTEVEPGALEELPVGSDFKTFDPTHPNTAFGGFVKSMLRRISSALGFSYEAMSGDLESVNYSSMRAGKIDEQENWKFLQEELVEGALDGIYEAWLFIQIGLGLIKLPLAKFDKFNSPFWQARRWAWVDPEKELKAKQIALQLGLDTRTDILAEQGKDREEIDRQLAQEKQEAGALGLTFNFDGNPAATAADAAAAAATAAAQGGANA